VFNHRRTTESNLRALGGVIALYSEAALEFGDRAAGSEALAVLQSVPQIEAAVLYDVQGNTFATFGTVPQGSEADASLAPGDHAERTLPGPDALDLPQRAARGHLWIRRGTRDFVSDLVAKFAALGAR
jgi:hypothetical protein